MHRRTSSRLSLWSIWRRGATLPGQRRGEHGRTRAVSSSTSSMCETRPRPRGPTTRAAATSRASRVSPRFCDAVAVVLFVFAFAPRYIVGVDRSGAALADQRVVDGERERGFGEDEVAGAQRLDGDGAAAALGVGVTLNVSAIARARKLTIAEARRRFGTPSGTQDA